MTSERIDDARQLLRAEYLGTPSLKMTPGEVAELLKVNRETALVVLQELEAAGFLIITDGRFGLARDRLRTASGVMPTGNRRAV